MRQTRLDGLRIVMGDEKCVMCTDRPGWEEFDGKRIAFRGKPCEKCKGTGRRGSGRCRACKGYDYAGRTPQPGDLPPGQVDDRDKPYALGPCPLCKGVMHRPVDWSSSLPPEVMSQVVDTIGVTVMARDGEMSRLESLIGLMSPRDDRLMSISSVVDYGRTWGRFVSAARPVPGDTDDIRAARIDALVDTFRSEIIAGLKADRVQICKVASKDGILGQTIIVSLAHNGYSLVTQTRPDDERAAILADAGVAV